MEPTLAEMVLRVAADPTGPHRAEFHRVLAASQVYFPAADAPPEPGRYVVKQGDNIAIPVVPGPTGGTMLVVFASQEALVAFHPGQPYAGMDGLAVLRIALANGRGVMVRSLNDGQPIWAGVIHEYLAPVLAQLPAQGS